MMTASDPVYRRYAVYLVPEGDGLASFGARWLGWDINTGRRVAHPDIADLPARVDQITASPRRYGLHATIVPPFYLAKDLQQTELLNRLESLSATTATVELQGLELAQLGRFLALVPVGTADALSDLAATWLEQLDPLRAPPSDPDLERHRARRLRPSQEALLARWGYPYVMEAFKAHITLTSKLPKAQACAVAQQLDPVLTPLLPQPFVIQQLALVGEDAEGWFHVIRQFPLRGPA
jgi:2'-5' RNA ligase